MKGRFNNCFFRTLIHAYAVTSLKPKVLLLDECFRFTTYALTFYSYSFPKARVVLCGDQDQISVCKDWFPTAEEYLDRYKHKPLALYDFWQPHMKKKCTFINNVSRRFGEEVIKVGRYLGIEAFNNIYSGVGRPTQITACHLKEMKITAKECNLALTFDTEGLTNYSDYGMTFTASQGITVDKANILVKSGTFIHQEQSYVGLTRQKYHLHFVICDANAEIELKIYDIIKMLYDPSIKFASSRREGIRQFLSKHEDLDNNNRIGGALGERRGVTVEQVENENVRECELETLLKGI
jgi:hypothetical protein